MCVDLLFNVTQRSTIVNGTRPNEIPKRPALLYVTSAFQVGVFVFFLHRPNRQSVEVCE